MPERTFLVQRYCSEAWPQVRGYRPFVVAGPRFESWIVPGSLGRLGRHLMVPGIRRLLRSSFPSGGIHRRHYQHATAAEVLLRESVLSTLWSIDSRECLGKEFRWIESIAQVAREIPFTDKWDLATSIEELLSGIPTAGMAREYVSEDRLTLEVTAIPIA